MYKRIQAIIASALLIAGFAAAPAFAAPASLPSCSATTLTDTQPGYVACIGANSGNMDNQLNTIYAKMATSVARGGFGFSTNTYFSSENFSALKNPFSQNEGNNDDGVINFDKALTGSFVLGLKQGNAYSLYLFNGNLVAGGISSIKYDTNGVKADSRSALSHAGFFGTPVSAVPEADTYAMLLAGLGMIGFVARRRKAK
ncbi:hypothetical protein ACFDR9_001928 [Janthinobacterium sp. CG_23.3]|uniref:PEP-CTERM sorting domain-containing protein n=1 Tax=Janthinobacterium sp. CG_23.3 TaxID=3349634 RepID=UPI0038D35656